MTLCCICRLGVRIMDSSRKTLIGGYCGTRLMECPLILTSVIQSIFLMTIAWRGNI